MKITVQPVPKNCFQTYLEAEKVMFIVFEWKELGVYDVRLGLANKDLGEF